uniref:Uncharacterized protein n=1 Tax=Bicosoecida sp. CB-2014 TaxID=1486930 RepID=A0A7S1C1N7_9STRA
MAAAAAAAAATDAGGVGKSQHDNMLYFDSNATVAIAFDMTAHTITGGQPWGGVTASGAAMDVKAGRHGSAGPAAAFADDISLFSALATDKIFASMPKDLNFEVEGTLTVTFAGDAAPRVCDAVRIGQGHYLFTNNWWLGGPHVVGLNLGQSFRHVMCSGGNVEVHTTGKSDHFYVLPA